VRRVTLRSAPAHDLVNGSPERRQPMSTVRRFLTVANRSQHDSRHSTERTTRQTARYADLRLFARSEHRCPAVPARPGAAHRHRHARCILTPIIDAQRASITMTRKSPGDTVLADSNETGPEVLVNTHGSADTRSRTRLGTRRQASAMAAPERMLGPRKGCSMRSRA